ncbi:MAG: hypothetical protein P0Y49_19225 [Candidatus Pedobacter colombiensis]|uniref:Uncharacterized protein n=1 Tax=Candidatus Pedobacter colombiensis TaxID=3121371 RepID=A0AAJ5W5G4_9SPHI|nr:hypothetical protein [Pedobacter sp.]WEK18908.1 MAG: hypothetical protein P0Y49_19225 [Pedobacter sp.]
MKNIITYLLASVILLVLFLLASCTKEEFKPYNNPFFHIMVDNKASIEVLSNRKDTVDYKVYLSAQLQFEPIDVQYEVKVGDGLQDGRDFKLITTGSTLNFPPGIFERPVRIAWKESVLDPAKNNTITIRLVSNSKNFTMGLPGPDQLQQQLVITKK